jgi:hypothetical protein
MVYYFTDDEVNQLEGYQMGNMLFLLGEQYRIAKYDYVLNGDCNKRQYVCVKVEVDKDGSWTTQKKRKT